jgi:hypothetical protein
MQEDIGVHDEEDERTERKKPKSGRSTLRKGSLMGLSRKRSPWFTPPTAIRK